MATGQEGLHLPVGGANEQILLDLDNEKCEALFLGVKYSPCSSRILTVYNSTAVVMGTGAAANATANYVNEPGRIYDFCWYPLCAQAGEASSYFLTSGNGYPVHLWSARGENVATLTSSFSIYDPNEQLQSAMSLTFNAHGSSVYAGSFGKVSTFDVSRPGRPLTERYTSGNDRSGGIVSAIEFNPDFSGIYAVGSYTGTVSLYEERTGDLLKEVEATEGNRSIHKNGVSHLQWTRDGRYLLSGGRKDSAVRVFDIRGSGSMLFELSRPSSTNQRLYFDIDTAAKHVYAGATDGYVYVYSLDTGELVCVWTRDGKKLSAPDMLPTNTMPPVNGVSLGKDSASMAITTGCRRFAGYDSSDEDNLPDNGGGWNQLLVHRL